jgi:hypothetical protein
MGAVDCVKLAVASPVTVGFAAIGSEGKVELCAGVNGLVGIWGSPLDETR